MALPSVWLIFLARSPPFLPFKPSTVRRSKIVIIELTVTETGRGEQRAGGQTSRVTTTAYSGFSGKEEKCKRAFETPAQINVVFGNYKASRRVAAIAPFCVLASCRQKSEEKKKSDERKETSMSNIYIYNTYTLPSFLYISMKKIISIRYRIIAENATPKFYAYSSRRPSLASTKNPLLLIHKVYYYTQTIVIGFFLF